MTNGDPNYYSSLVTDNTAGTITTGSYYYDESSPNINDWGYRYYTAPVIIPTPFTYFPTIEEMNNNKKGDDDMRYLYEVILVNPKNDTFYVDRVVARSETSAMMAVYAESNFIQPPSVVKFDDLKTSCRVLMEWKKEKSLEKALETIKKAVEW